MILFDKLFKALAFKEKHEIQESIFMGVFNARHHFWGDHRYNDAGLSLCNVEYFFFVGKFDQKKK